MHLSNPSFPRARLALAAWLASTLLSAAAPSHAALFAGSFSATPPAFSPNADGTNDVTSLRFTLADTAASLSLIVFAADSIAPIDTLLAPAPDSTTGARVFSWDGTRSNGSPAPEGAYVVTLSGRAAGGVDTTLSIPVFLDLTPPSLAINGVSPAVYAPGLSGQPSVLSVTFRIAGVSPPQAGRVPDELQPSVLTPSGTRVTDADLDGRISFVPTLPVVTPPSVTADGDYTLLWDAQGQTGIVDGIYRIVLTAVDAAGFTVTDTSRAVLDVTAPSVRFTNIAANAVLRSAPDTLYGLAIDSGGIDTLSFRYGSSPFAPLAPTGASGDTTFFEVFLADSVGADSTYALSVRAVDSVGRSATGNLNFTLDTTAPAPPTLDAFSGVWHSSSYTLTGSAPAEVAIGGVIHVYRNGALVDSTVTTTSPGFSVTVLLVEGVNRLTATYVDLAGNESPSSNAVVVTLDTGAGLFMPVPFVPGDRFTFTPTAAVLSGGAAGTAELRLYDLAGNVVRILTATGPATTYEFPWNGQNENGILVNRGPLVAVAIARGPQTTERVRKVFLFDPGR